MSDAVLLKITTAGRFAKLPADSGEIAEATLAAHLDTDVTERLRITEPLQGLLDASVCYFIDARGGDKALDTNFIGTALYHSDCPLFGDLLFARCGAQDAEGSVSAFTDAEAEALLTWLRAQFPGLLTLQ